MGREAIAGNVNDQRLEGRLGVDWVDGICYCQRRRRRQSTHTHKYLLAAAGRRHFGHFLVRLLAGHFDYMVL